MTAVLEPVSPPVFRFKKMASSSRSPDRGSVQQVAIKALQTRNVKVERLDRSVFRAFRLQPLSDFFYVLRCRPSSHARLLRHEEERLQTEAIVLQTLRGRTDLLVPRLIEYNKTIMPLGSQYLINGPFKGSILSEVEPDLSTQALASIDKSLGRYVRQLAQVTGPAFGAVRPLNGSSSTTTTWSRCFASLLESALRDGEDALISLPYDFIRDQSRRHRAVLDQITQPSLVILEMSADKNIVVDTNNNTVSGILDFSTAIWGDPFMSDCFYQPSASFPEGFGRLPIRDTSERTRQYLYVLYHSLLAVVRQCYRPSEDGDELAARRKLTAALTQLGNISRG
ncbi:hypothetical protein M409DRAFT_55077 [Zasmidium cellare ATCC 36951]|uniref:Aminoglycoside phosphotransferase domain-containing protein n=1 Tax=Zasmidium cellare ATCC 36951 TaxID=1080233 RepID=A0A6A6CHW9_ZASCE|nr:uncharacterized protein M409DRAFT_55077 [Zasmidium cellare ATCC 36951]KAF2166213.1 hypothetical protein M409DRAFT_55077 [Zasmidium cellare ATCC 36951]